MASVKRVAAAVSPCAAAATDKEKRARKMSTGWIDFVDADAGYGFVRREGDEKTLFFETRNCAAGVGPGLGRVRFEERLDHRTFDRRRGGRLECMSLEAFNLAPIDGGDA
jgi:hypothetical protein